MRTVAAMASFVALLAAAGAHSRTQPSESVNTHPPAPALETRSHVYENGLTLLVREDASAPVVSVQAWCGSGSIHEGRWIGAGLSHILEHMLFKGTETRGVADIARTIQGIGGQVNAYTSFDRTVFYIDAPCAGWKTCIDVLTDAIFNSTLPEAEYTKEQEVIRREFAMGHDDPGRMSFHTLFEHAFAHHPMRHPVIGHIDIFNTLTRQDVLDYHRSRYVPNNLTFVVAGDVRFTEVRDFLGKAIEPEKRRPLPDVYIPAEPPQLGRRDYHTPFRTERTYLRMGFHIPPITHPDLYPLDVLGTLLGDGRTSRLHTRIVERERLAESVDAFAFTPGDEGLFVISAVCDPAKRDAVTAAALDEIARLGREGPSDTELNKAKRQALSGRFHTLETMSGQAAEIGTAWFAARDPAFADQYIGRLDRVTGADVRRVIQTYFRNENLTVISLNPKTSEPAGESAKAAPASAQQTADVATFHLPSGIRLLVRRNSKVPLASIRVVLRSGVLQERQETSGISRLAASCLLKGTDTRSADQIASEIEDLGGSIESSGAYNSAMVSVDVLSRDLDRGIEIAADVLLHPAFPPEEVDKERELQLRALQAEQDEMMAVCRNVLRRRFYGDAHPYAMNPLGREETLRALRPEDLRAHHRALCVSSNLVVSVFGDADPDATRTAVERHFRAVPVGAAPPLPQVRPAISEPARVEEFRDKSQAVVQIGFPGIAVDSPDRFAMEILAEALADMGSRLFIRIREEKGLAYYVGAAQNMGLIPGHFVLYAGTAPDKADAVAKDLLAEAAIVRESGLTADEIDRAKTRLVAAQQMQRQHNGASAYAVALDELYGLGTAFQRDYATRIRAVTPKDVADAARRHLAPDRYVIAIVRPKP